MKNFLTPYQSIVKLPKIIQQVLIITMAATLIMGIIWSRDGVGLGAKILFTLSFVSLLLLVINHYGFSVFAGILLIVVLLIGATAEAIRQDGYYNVPAIVYPILVVMSGMFFGKKYVPAFTLLTLLILISFNYLEQIGVIVPFHGLVSYYDGDFITVIILQSATGIILLLLMVIFENNVEKIYQSEQSLQETYDLTLQGWAKSLELRGYDPEGHHQKTAELVKEFGCFLGLDKNNQEILYNGALLHDIGKIGISESILLKQGELTASEFEVVKKHTLIGNEILKEVPELDQVREIVLYHHEQWDGNGYPEGKSEEGIPLGARIFAIIDNWTSLTHDLIYRKAWSREKTLNYLKEQAGKKFDPILTEKFIAFLGEMEK